MRANPQKTGDSVTFIKEIVNARLHFLVQCGNIDMKEIEPLHNL